MPSFRVIGGPSFGVLPRVDRMPLGASSVRSSSAVIGCPYRRILLMPMPRPYDFRTELARFS